MTEHSDSHRHQGGGEGDADSRDGGSHRDVVDEGPLPGEDIADELTDEQVDAEERSPHSAQELKTALEDQRDRYLRLAAEFENFRRRTTKERLEAFSRGQADLASSLLEPLDDLNRFAAVDVANADPVSIFTGVDLVTRKLAKLLGTAGLERIDPQDEAFDPAVHEAVSTTPALSPEDDDMVGAVFQPGYSFKGQLLRPARVVVKKWNG